MGLLGSLFGEDTGDKLLRAMAIRNKDYGAAAGISDDLRKRKQDRLDTEEARKAEAELTGLFFQEFKAQGYGDEDADRLSRLAMLDAKSGGKSIAERLAPRTMGPDQTLLFGRKPEYTTPSAPTAEQRNFQTWRGFDEPTKREFSEYQSQIGPRWVTGPDGKAYPVPPSYGGASGLPQGFDPNEWEIVPGPGGGGGNATGGFR